MPYDGENRMDEPSRAGAHRAGICCLRAQGDEGNMIGRLIGRCWSIIRLIEAVASKFLPAGLIVPKARDAGIDKSCWWARSRLALTSEASGRNSAASGPSFQFSLPGKPQQRVVVGRWS